MNKFLSFIESFWNSVEHLFITFVQQALPVAKQAILNDILPAAEKAVGDYLNQDLTGDQKRAAVFADIMAGLKAAQKDIEPSLVNLAIELAYQKVQTIPTGSSTDNALSASVTTPAPAV